MAKQTKISYNLTGLEDLRKQIGDDYIARVGVLGSKNSRGGEPMGNADLLLIQIFGSVTNNIPPRDALRMPIELKRKELINGMQGSMVRAAVAEGNFKKVYQILGALGLQIIDGAYSSGGYGRWPSLKPSTIRAKGSSAILIDTGELRRAQTYDVVRKGEVL